MLRGPGNKDSSIWLMGDSSLLKWGEYLDEPLDSRHPARHDIWTTVLEGIQKQVFLGDCRRVDDSQLYVRSDLPPTRPTLAPPLTVLRKLQNPTGVMGVGRRARKAYKGCRMASVPGAVARAGKPYWGASAPQCLHASIALPAACPS